MNTPTPTPEILPGTRLGHAAADNVGAITTRGGEAAAPRSSNLALITSSADFPTGASRTTVTEASTASADMPPATSETEYILSPEPTKSSSPTAQPSGQSITQGNQASHDIHLAVIISLVALGLVVTLMITLLVWYCIRHRRKKATQIKSQFTGVLDLKEEPGRRSLGSDETSLEEAESPGAIENARGFNSLEMVVDRSVITSMAWSLGKGSSNSPPPYGNASQTRNQRPGAGREEESQMGNSETHSSKSRGSASLTIPQQPPPSAEGGIGGVATMANMLPSQVTVQYTFTPVNHDELEVKRGDRLRIAGVFDDGWCLCWTETRRVGVVPMACFGSLSGMGSINDVEPNEPESTGVVGSDENRESKHAGNRVEAGGKEASIGEVKRSPRIASLTVTVV